MLLHLRNPHHQKNLKALRETNGEYKCNLFKAMGLDYIYVKEGNKVADLIEAFKQVKDTKKAVANMGCGRRRQIKAKTERGNQAGN